MAEARHLEVVSSGHDAPRGWTLRVSVTDRCQYRCPYCRPGSVAPFSPARERLGLEDYRRLAPHFADLGVRKVRFTGGEPLLRPDLPEIVRTFTSRSPGCNVTLTTNGMLLDRALAALVDAGLGGATVHVDTLRPERYHELMGEGDVHEVLRAVVAAKAKLREVKLNTVIQRSRNVDEIGDFLTYSRTSGVEVRFIELMNTGSATRYTRDAFFSGREIVDVVRTIAGATPIPRREPSDPAALWRTDDGLVFGVIASDSEPFCGACNRLRLTATGDLRGCLYQPVGVDLSEPARSGTDAEIRSQIRLAMATKRSFHPDTTAPGRVRFSMAQTGG